MKKEITPERSTRKLISKKLIVPTILFLSLSLAAPACGKATIYADKVTVNGALESAAPAASPTPKPSEAAGTPNPEIKTSPDIKITETPARPGTDIELDENATAAINPGTVISGDIAATLIATGRTDLFDKNRPGTEKTGLIVEFGGTSPTTINAPFGASGRTGLKNLEEMDKEAKFQAGETFRVRPEIKGIMLIRLDNGQIVDTRFIGDASLFAQTETPTVSIVSAPIITQPVVEIRQAADDGVAFALNEGQEAIVSKAVFSGDDLINGERRFDDDPTSGLMFVILDSAKITTTSFKGSGRANFNTRAGIDAEAQKELNATFAARPEINRVRKITVQNGQVIGDVTISRP